MKYAIKAICSNCGFEYEFMPATLNLSWAEAAKANAQRMHEIKNPNCDFVE